MVTGTLLRSPVISITSLNSQPVPVGDSSSDNARPGIQGVPFYDAEMLTPGGTLAITGYCTSGPNRIFASPSVVATGPSMVGVGDGVSVSRGVLTGGVVLSAVTVLRYREWQSRSQGRR